MTHTWKLYVDGSFNVDRNEAMIVLVSHKEQVFEYEVCFDFPCMNNVLEYEVFLAVLQRL
jgi:hypothetical protein